MQQADVTKSGRISHFSRLPCAHYKGQQTAKERCVSLAEELHPENKEYGIKNPFFCISCENGTSFIRFSSREHGHEAIPSCVGIGNHLHHHLVATGHKGSRPERPTEASNTLTIGMAIVHIHKVIAAQVITLEVYESEIKNDYFSLWNLPASKGGDSAVNSVKAV